MKTSSVLALSLLAWSGIGGNGQSAPSLYDKSAQLKATSTTSKPASPALVANYGKLPLCFEANQGQANPQVRFLSRGNGYSLFLTDSAAVLALTKGDPAKKGAHSAGFSGNLPDTEHTKTNVVRMELAGASHYLHITGAEQFPSTVNYVIGNDPAKWHSNLPTYAKVKYAGVYPGVDLVYYGNQRQLEYDFVVAPGADPKHVKLHFAGATKLKLNADGDLGVIGRNGEIAFRKPIVYQMKDGQRQPVEGRFKLLGRNGVGFTLGDYDRRRDLVIDPVLAYSTYLGGSGGQDRANAIAVDNDGNAYVAGVTNSPDFPTVKPLQGTLSPQAFTIAFVSKINAEGSAFVYSTYLGGNGVDGATGIAVDTSGNAYVTGYAADAEFPTVNPLQGTDHSPSYNAFISKVSADGSSLLFSTYLGGSGQNGDLAECIALDTDGNAYIAGYTESSDFPTLHPLQSSLKGRANAFLSKIKADGSALMYSTFLGGTNVDEAFAIATDASGNAYVAGQTLSTDFPTVKALEGTLLSSSGDGFVSKINASGSALVYSTYLGGSAATDPYYGDHADGIAVDSGGDAYVTGTTLSADFPLVKPLLSTLVGEESAFVSRIKSDGSAFVYSTYLGGYNYGYAIAADSKQNAYVGGQTYCLTLPMINPVQSCTENEIQSLAYAFISRINADGSAITFSTPLGGGSDYAFGVALDPSGDVYLAGLTESSTFPTVGAIEKILLGVQDGFVAKIHLTLGATGTTSRLSSSANPASIGESVVFTLMVAGSGGNTPVPTGTMTLLDGSSVLGTQSLDSSGVAIFSIDTLTVGAHAITANYSGDSVYAPSSASLTETIAGPAASISVVSGSGQTAKVGSSFAVPLVVLVEDENGTPVPGTVVSFSGAGLEFSSTMATVTGSTGETSVVATPTSTGTLTATANVSGVQSGAVFALTGASGAPSGLQFIPASPCRVADTRGSIGPFGGPELSAQQTREFDIPQSACNIPSTAVAYSLNVTVVPNGSLNYLTLWPAGEKQPNVSTLNSDGRIKANAAITPAGAKGGIDVFVSDASQVILDIDGYFVPSGTASALAFYPVTPCRVADTRSGGGALGAPFMPANSSRAVPVLSSNCGLPSTAQAYSLNVTAVPHTILDYLTAWPTGQTQPVVSTLNATTGTVTANAAIVPAASNGEISLFVSNDADVILDVTGYFAPLANGGLSLYAVTPCRAIDTRPVPFAGTDPFSIQGSSCAPPTTAQAYVLNATAVPAGALAYLSLWPSGESQPVVSTLNAIDGSITSNMAIVPNSNGSVDAFVDGTTNLILDITSYFAP